MSINLRRISNFISVRTKKQVNYMEGNRTDDSPIPEQYGGQPLALGSAILNTNTGITEYVVDGDCNAQVLANFIDVKTKQDVSLLIINWLSTIEKPAELFGKPVAIGSRLLEADTGTLYAHYGDGDYQPIATGGGGGGQIWMFVGNVDETTTAFPTTRPSGDELVNGDYVKVASGATLPFTVEGIEFTSPKDQAVYLGGEWVLNANPFQNTKETPLQDATVESISGTAHNQKETNIEVVEKLRVNAYSVLSDLEDYLFDVYYDRIDYDYAEKYFTDMPVFGACSSIKKGNFFAKSHDWKYDEMANFVVHTPNKDGRYATLGVSTSITDLNNEFVKSRAYNENYRAVPLCIADGINDKGLACSIAVVPQDNGDNHNVNASVEERQKFHYMMIPRYVLDYFDNAQTAVEYLRDYVSFYMSDTSQIDVHYIVSDAEKTYVVEFINGITTIKDITANPYMTNFTLANTTLNADGSVYTPETQDATHKPTTTNNITPHGQGLERHNLIVDTYNALEDDVDFKALLEALHYTKTYDTAPVVSDPYWYSELTDETHTVDTTVADYADIKSATGSAYTTRTRDGETYQTTHSSLYNTEELTLLVMPQETDHEYNFHIPKGADLKTENVEITNSATESLDGLAVRQNEANEQFVEKIKELEPLVLIAEENQTINGYQVPKLTEDDITAVYNAQIAGKQVIIKDATENYTFAPKQVDTDTDDIYVCFDFCDVMILTYKTTADGVETDYKEYGGNAVINIEASIAFTEDEKKYWDFTNEQLEQIVEAYNTNKLIRLTTPEGIIYVIPDFRVIEEADDTYIQLTYEYNYEDNNSTQSQTVMNTYSLNGAFEPMVVEIDHYSYPWTIAENTTVDGVEVPNITVSDFGKVQYRIGRVPIFVKDSKGSVYFINGFNDTKEPDPSSHRIYKFILTNENGVNIQYTVKTADSSVDIKVLKADSEPVVVIENVGYKEGHPYGYSLILDLTVDMMDQIAEAYENKKSVLLKDVSGEYHNITNFMTGEYGDKLVIIDEAEKLVGYTSIAGLDEVLYEVQLHYLEIIPQIPNLIVDGVEVPHLTAGDFSLVASSFETASIRIGDRYGSNEKYNVISRGTLREGTETKYIIRLLNKDGYIIEYKNGVFEEVEEPTVSIKKIGEVEKSDVGDVIASTALDTQEKVITAKGGTAWTLLSDIDGVYQWERTA